MSVVSAGVSSYYVQGSIGASCSELALHLFWQFLSIETEEKPTQPFHGQVMYPMIPVCPVPTWRTVPENKENQYTYIRVYIYITRRQNKQNMGRAFSPAAIFRQRQ